VVVVIVTAAASSIVLTDNALNVAQGQAGGNITLTPAQKAAMCNPNNLSLKFVNTTESHICGLPKSIPSTSTTSSTELPTPTTPPPPPSTTQQP
jgi:hypothetical protein